LWLLQSRTAKRTALAALQIACDLVSEGVIDTSTALERLRGYDLDRITRRHLADPGVEPLARATPAGGGVASGWIALDVASAMRRAALGDDVVLVREEASTDDVAGLAACRGVLTATGARTSHAAVVARQLGIACLVNCPGLAVDIEARRVRIGGQPLGEDDRVTIDGSTGAIYPGVLRWTEERPVELINAVRAWQRQLAPARP
jgi:pyruvate,orthophosphate dikinase